MKIKYIVDLLYQGDEKDFSEFKQSLFKNNNEAEIKKQISTIDKKIKEIYKRYFPAVGKQIQYHVEKTQSNSKENKKMVDIITTSKKLDIKIYIIILI